MGCRLSNDSRMFDGTDAHAERLRALSCLLGSALLLQVLAACGSGRPTAVRSPPEPEERRGAPTEVALTTSAPGTQESCEHVLPGSEPVKLALRTLETLQAVCLGLADHDPPALIVVAPPDVSVPLALGGVPVLRASSLEHASRSVSRVGTIVVDVAMAGESLSCHYRRSIGHGRYESYTTIFWTLSERSDGTTCIRLRRQVLSWKKPFRTIGNR